MSKLANFRRAFIKAAARTSLRQSFVANAGKIGGFSWLAADPLIMIDRTLKNHALTIDCLTVGGGIGMVASISFLFSDRYPVFKRIGSTIFISSIPIFMSDSPELSKKVLMGLGLLCPIITSLAMIFERNAKNKKQIEVNNEFEIAINKHVSESTFNDLKKAPIFWSSMISGLTKSLLFTYAAMGHDWWAAGGMFCYALTNLSTACMDKTVTDGIKTLRPTINAPSLEAHA